MDIVKDKVMNLISEGKISEALNILRKTVNHSSPAFQELILIYSRYEQIKMHKIQGTVSSDFISLEENRIRSSIVDLIYRLKHEDYEKGINVTVELRSNEKNKFQPNKDNWWIRFKKKLARLFTFSHA